MRFENREMVASYVRCYHEAEGRRRRRKKGPVFRIQVIGDSETRAVSALKCTVVAGCLEHVLRRTAAWPFKGMLVESVLAAAVARRARDRDRNAMGSAGTGGR